MDYRNNSTNTNGGGGGGGVKGAFYQNNSGNPGSNKKSRHNKNRNNNHINNINNNINNTNNNKNNNINTNMPLSVKNNINDYDYGNANTSDNYSSLPHNNYNNNFAKFTSYNNQNYQNQKKHRPPFNNKRRNGSQGNYGYNENFNDRLNKSLNLNNNYEENSKMPTSISLDNFDLAGSFKNRSPKSMPNSYSFMSSNIPLPVSSYKNNFIQQKQSIIEMDETKAPSGSVGEMMAERKEDAFERSTNFGDTTSASCYSTPMNHVLDSSKQVDPDYSPKKHKDSNGENSSMTASDESGASPIKYEDSMESSENITTVKNEEEKLSDEFLTSSSSISSPDSKNNYGDESQPLVTASEGESSFNAEPSTENTITVIETSFGNEYSNDHQQQHLAQLNANFGLSMKATEESESSKESSFEQSDNTESIKSAEDSEVPLPLEEDEKTSEQLEEEEKKTTDELDLIISEEENALNKIQSLTLLLKQDESNSLEHKLQADMSCQMTPTSIEPTVGSFTDLLVEEPCQLVCDKKADTDIINYSTQVNYPSSSNSDLSSSSSSSSQHTLPDSKAEELAELYEDPSKFFNIEYEVSSLINKIVFDAIAKALEVTNVETYVEININETLNENEVDFSEKEVKMSDLEEKAQADLNIVPVMEEEEEEKRKAQLELAAADKAEETAAKESVSYSTKAQEEKAIDVSQVLANESTASISSKQKVVVQKDPLIDCFSCTIV